MPWVRIDEEFTFDTEAGPKTLLCASRSPLETLQAYKHELPGMSAFALQDGVVYHTYSCFARGGDVLMGIYQLLDRAPAGRNESGFEHHPMEWVRRHDEYVSTESKEATP